jgi:L-threonylcarbamoyladenylate synthase
MKTLRLILDSRGLAGSFAAGDVPSPIEQAARILKSGGLVAFPTETVYGLGANALDRAAVEGIFRAKQRPAWDPVIVHVAPLDRRQSMLEVLVEEIPETARLLIEAFWPGPLTLLLPRRREVPDAVTAGRPLVGVRMPAHPAALALIRRAEVPVAAPSANRFGHTSPTTAAHVLDDLDGRIDAVLDAGPTEHGVESTVLDPTQSPMVIYRPGAVTAGQIRAVAGPVELFREPAAPAPEPKESLPAPGVGLRHYAPCAQLILIEADAEDGAAGLAASMAAEARKYSGKKLGIMLPEGIDMREEFNGAQVLRWGRWDSPEAMARELYAGLRRLDGDACQVILCPLPPEQGIGAAIRDRLRKAAR